MTSLNVTQLASDIAASLTRTGIRIPSDREPLIAEVIQRALEQSLPSNERRYKGALERLAQYPTSGAVIYGAAEGMKAIAIEALQERPARESLQATELPPDPDLRDPISQAIAQRIDRTNSGAPGTDGARNACIRGRPRTGMGERI